MHASLCRERGDPFLRLDGSTSINKRQKLVQQFNDPAQKQFVFLLSSKAELKKAEKEIQERVRTARHQVKLLQRELDIARSQVLHAHRLILAQPLTGEVLATSATDATGALVRPALAVTKATTVLEAPEVSLYQHYF